MQERKKIFLDTEFTGLHMDTTLISIGLLSGEGETFYAELNDYDVAQVTEWVKENVIRELFYAPPLKGEDEFFSWNKNNKVRMRGNKEEVRRYLEDWFQAILGGPMSWVEYENPIPAEVTKPYIEIWSDCLSYDWVLFNDLWNSSGMLTPKCIYYIPFDICTFFKLKDIDPDISREEYIQNAIEGTKHNALYDAKVIHACYENLKKEK